MIKKIIAVILSVLILSAVAVPAFAEVTPTDAPEDDEPRVVIAGVEKGKEKTKSLFYGQILVVEAKPSEGYNVRWFVDNEEDKEARGEAKYKFEAERGGEYVITAKIVDADGNIVPDAQDTVTVKVSAGLLQILLSLILHTILGFSREVTI